ncbi:MAG TPA: sulfatase [Gemmatimonadales bacterium]|nr:sulfatase [Gemmatimonadales bacterium]
MNSDHPSVASRPGVSQIAVLALWFALLAGLIEAAWGSIERYGLNRFMRVPQDIVWMAPVVDAFWLVIPVMLLLLACRLAPRVVSQNAVAGLLGGFAALPPLLLITELHKGVAVLLAVGIGVQIGHIATILPNGFNRVVRRTLPVAVGAFVLGTGFVVGSQRLTERRAILARPEAPPGKPNVLLIVWDTVRGQSLSAYGYDRPTTPFLTSLSREGVRFARAVSTAPWTLPSHGSIFTGQWPYVFFRGLWKPIETPTPTIATVLSEAGYATAGFTANPYYTSPSHRIDQGFRHYEEHGHGLSTAFAKARLGYVLEHAEWFRELTEHDDLFDRKSADDVSRSFLHWLDDQGDTPFFVFLNFYDAHRPYVAPSPFRERFARAKPDDSERARAIRREEDHEDWYQDEYDGLIAYLDDATRRLLGDLDRRGVLDNTVVIITADHGDQFGEHGKWFHMNSLYRPLLDVPLVVRFPRGVPRDTVIETPVSLRDIPQTVLALTGVTSAVVPGQSLTRFWTGEPRSADSLILSELSIRAGPELGPVSIISNGLHYIVTDKDSIELYHYINDPSETSSLRDSPEHKEILAGFRRLTDSLSALCSRVRARTLMLSSESDDDH